MTTVLTIVVAVIVFGVVVLVHEWGHFRAARRCGVRVNEFSIGFGPAIWQHEGKDGTLYSIRLLPLGGYNAMSGYSEEGDAESQPPVKKPKGAPVLPDAIDGKTYPEATTGQRFFIIASGALMNFVLGFVLLIILVCTQDAIATKSSTISPTMHSVSRRVCKRRMRSSPSTGITASRPMTSSMNCSVPLTIVPISRFCGTEK